MTSARNDCWCTSEHESCLFKCQMISLPYWSVCVKWICYDRCETCVHAVQWCSKYDRDAKCNKYLNIFYINKVAVCVCVCLSGTFSYTITYFYVTITQVLVQTFTTRGKQQLTQSATFLSQLGTPSKKNPGYLMTSWNKVGR